jgi:regulatory protein
LKKKIVTKVYTDEQVIEKLEHFCAYQERCVADVKKKLYQLNVSISEYEQFINYLTEHNFLNEKRFTERFTQGKLNIKNWGKIKISYQLKQKNIDTNYIEHELNCIDDEMYKDKLQQILIKKNKLLKEADEYKKRQKLIIYAQQKGFELDLILKTIDKIL